MLAAFACSVRERAAATDGMVFNMSTDGKGQSLTTAAVVSFLPEEAKKA